MCIHITFRKFAFMVAYMYVENIDHVDLWHYSFMGHFFTSKIIHHSGCDNVGSTPQVALKEGRDE
jgi:hypothetical protein